jgi:hypothetical protein
VKVEVTDDQTISSTFVGELEIGVFMISLSSFVDATSNLEVTNPIQEMRQVAISMLDTLLKSLEDVNFFEPLEEIET